MVVNASGQVELAFARPDPYRFLAGPGSIDVVLDEKKIGEGVGGRVVGQAGVVEEDDPLAAGDAALQRESCLARDSCLGAGRCGRAEGVVTGDGEVALFNMGEALESAGA